MGYQLPLLKNVCQISSEITSKQFCLVAMPKYAIAKVFINSKYFHSHASFEVFLRQKKNSLGKVQILIAHKSMSFDDQKTSRRGTT